MADLEGGRPGRRCPAAGGTVPRPGPGNYCLVKAARTAHQPAPASTTSASQDGDGSHDGGSPIGLMLADAGYSSEDNLTTAGPDRLIATSKHRDLEKTARQATAHTPAKEEDADGAEAPFAAMAAGLAAPEGREDVNYPTINQGNASSNLAHPKHSSTPKHNGPVVGRTGGGLRRDHRSYAVRMSDSPLSPQEIRAAAAAHAELGPEYSDADWARWHWGGHASARTGPWVGQG